MSSLIGAASSTTTNSSSPTTTNTPTAFHTLLTHLLTLPAPLLPPSHPTSSPLTDRISSLYLHPALESALHLLNADLPSAHFLCRHMQAAPAYEGMFLHGILHRIEGDYDNARAWYADVVDSDVFREVWGAETEEREVRGKGVVRVSGKAMRFVGRVQGLREGKGGGRGQEEGVQKEREELGRESMREIRSVIEFCVRKFGVESVRDASGSWEQPEKDGEHARMGQEMVTGDKGFRKF